MTREQPEQPKRELPWWVWYGMGIPIGWVLGGWIDPWIKQWLDR